MAVLIFCSMMLTVNAQEIETIKPNVQVTYAKKLGTTPALKYLIPRSVTDHAKKSAGKKMIRPPRNFVGRNKSKVVNPKMEHTGPDKLRQTSFSRSTSTVVEPLINVEGLTNGRSPQDPSGDVGENFYMQAINATQIGLFNKSDGSLATSFTGNTLWNSLGFTSAGDPIIMYDQEFNRWIITEFANQGNNLMVAISDTQDPMGEYNVYNFTTPNFPDYPKYSIWTDSYTVTTNEQGPGRLHSYFINREQLLLGAEDVLMQRINVPGNSNTEAGFFVSSPVDWSGTQAPPQDRKPMFLSLNDASWNVGETEDKVEIFSVDVDWETPANTSIERQSLVVSPYDANPCAAEGIGFSCIPQMGGNGLDGIPEVIMHQIHYRNFGSYETMVMNFVTDVTDGENIAGIRWMELRRTTDEEWSVYQEGTFAPADNLNRFMGSIAMDGSGNIGLAYNVSGAEDFAGVRFTGRRAGDPLGEMTVNEYEVVEGGSTIQSFGRFGDYAHMTIDPFDDKTFWFTTEYAGPFDVRTRILAFELKKDTFDIGPVANKNLLSGSLLTDSESVIVDIENFGLDTIQQFEVGYIFEEGSEVKEMVTVELLPDSSYTHTFQTPVDVSELGEYDIKLFTSLSIDQNVLNDTTNSVINHIPQVDLSISGVEPIGMVCGDETTVDFNILNLGTLDITDATFAVSLNGIDLATQTFSNALIANQSSVLPVDFTDLLDGSNTLEIQVLTVNGQNGDEIDGNNSFSIDFEASTNGFDGNIEILTDRFGIETTWTLTTDTGELVAEGGPYDGMNLTAIDNPVCLDPDLCYIFTISDSYEDGMNFGIDGGYTITNDEGAVLASIMDSAFGAEEVNNFCGLFECSVEATASTSPTTSASIADGIIMVEVTNGAGPFEFSLDGDNFQSGNIFRDLAEGLYTVTVRGSGDCLFEFETTILACALDVAVTVTPETDFESNDGTMSFDISGAFGTTLVSINGGGSLGTATEFDGLGVGDYEVFVRDSLGCEFTEIVHLGNVLSSGETTIGSVAKLYPNPTEGVFQVELIGTSSKDVYIPLTLYNVKGEVIQRNYAAKYDDAHLGTLSLFHYPEGVYFLRIEDANFDKLIRVIKQ